MRILALVPARGGSKRLPGKNLRPLHGKPLIAHSIDVVLGLSEVCAILTSTDDRDIARAAESAGSLVPWLRPAELATDTASSIDVCLHALDWFEREHGAVDGLLLLQPTSPLRTRASVLRGIELFRDFAPKTVIGVSPASSHPYWCFRVIDGVLRPFLPNVDLNARSQDLPPAYVANGAFYLASPAVLRRLHSFFGDDIVPLVMNENEGVDIDTESDWIIAETATNGLRSAS